MKQKKNFLIIFIIFHVINIYSNTPNWQRVAGGDPVAQPVITNYGFVMILDGRTIASVSKEGHLLWESGIPGGKPSPFIEIGKNDFIFTVSGNSTLTAFNPSGLKLWTTTAPNKIISKPLQGFDGRIFIQMENSITCYGINGVEKWTTSVGLAANFPLLQLQDGSILHIQQKTINGCSTALRISPFGDILEEITFTGKIIEAEESENGIILLFSDGAAGCCSSMNNISRSTWVLPTGTLSTNHSKILISEDKKTCAFLSGEGSETNIVILNHKDGTISARFKTNINSSNLSYANFDSDTIILCDKKNIAGFNIDGKTLFSTTNPSKKDWSYLLFLENGYIVVFERNTWITSAYRITQKIGNKKNIDTNKLLKKKNYDFFTTEAAKKIGITTETSNLFGKTIPENLYTQIKTGITTYQYGIEEAIWIGALKLECNQIINRYMKKAGNFLKETSTVDSNLPYYQEILMLLPYFGSDTFNKTLASIIQKETNSSLLETAIKTAGFIGYDPEGVLLTSIQQTLYKKNSLSNTRFSIQICDAVFEICKFMGKPALLKQGKQILSYILNQTSDNKAKIHATITLEKIIALGM